MTPSGAKDNSFRRASPQEPSHCRSTPYARFSGSSFYIGAKVLSTPRGHGPVAPIRCRLVVGIDDFYRARAAMALVDLCASPEGVLPLKDGFLALVEAVGAEPVRRLLPVVPRPELVD